MEIQKNCLVHPSAFMSPTLEPSFFEPDLVAAVPVTSAPLSIDATVRWSRSCWKLKPDVALPSTLLSGSGFGRCQMPNSVVIFSKGIFLTKMTETFWF